MPRDWSKFNAYATGKAAFCSARRKGEDAYAALLKHSPFSGEADSAKWASDVIADVYADGVDLSPDSGC